MSDITKRALEQSLKNLLAKKPLNKITISDITEDCGINRMTFYYHFENIYDLAEWACVENAKRAIEGKKTYDTWQKGLLNIFHAVLENKTLILNVYHCVDLEQLERYLNPLVRALILSIVEEKAVGLCVSEDDKTFIASFYEYALVGIMLNWIHDGLRENPEILTDRIATLLHGNIEKALSDFSMNKSTSNPPVC